MRHIKRGGKVWIRIFPDRVITEKPAEVRQGKGKGAPVGWFAPVKPGRMEVTTDGSISPDDAISYSAKILKDQLSVFINFDEKESEADKARRRDDIELNPSLFKSIDELELSVRATNCLKSANIQSVGELMQKTENEMLKTKNFGKKSLEEIRHVLEDMGLEFGMRIENFEQKYQEWLKRKQVDET